MMQGVNCGPFILELEAWEIQATFKAGTKHAFENITARNGITLRPNQKKTRGGVSRPAELTDKTLAVSGG